MSLEAFKHSRKGERIAPILASEAELAKIEAKARAGRPAVEAIGARIASEVGSLSDQEKKLVGRWVKEVLVGRGWKPIKKGRVVAGNLFSRGTIYRKQADVVPSRASAAERVAAARAILAQSPYPIMSSEELIAERHQAFERGE